MPGLIIQFHEVINFHHIFGVGEGAYYIPVPVSIVAMHENNMRSTLNVDDWTIL
jgi:hypothetical protein